MQSQLTSTETINLAQMAADTSTTELRARHPETQPQPESEASPPYETSPDLAYDTKEGWPVVAAGSAIFFVFLGLIYSYGIVQLHLAKSHLASVSTLSFIGSVGAAMSPLTGTLVARVIRVAGYRYTAFLGGIFLGLGEFTAGWATKSVPAMFVTQGFLFGVGAGLLFLVGCSCYHILSLKVRYLGHANPQQPAATVPSLWFKRRRGLATGVVYGGAGFGSAIIALTLEKLISATGLETALKILGGASWAICLPAAYFLKAPAGRERAVATMKW